MKDLLDMVINSKARTHIIGNSFDFCWVVALRAEAAPIIEFFDMKILSNDLLFPIYYNQVTGHALVISGIGAIKSASAATFMKARLSIKNHVAWINIGIAGYFQDSIGELFQAVKVTAKDTKKTFSPGLRFSRIVKSSSLVTVPQIEKDYADRTLYDMEAAGFCEICPSLSCNELTYVFKVVSDSPNHSSAKLLKRIVSNLIENQLAKVFEISREISKVVEEEKKRLYIPVEVKEVEDLMKFSETNRHRFREAYRKWKVLYPDKYFLISDFPKSSARELIAFLEEELLIKSEQWTIS